MLIRTTVTLPEALIKEAKYYAVTYKTNLSQLIRESLAERIKSRLKTKSSSLSSLAGTLDLKGKQPPIRSNLYKKHIGQ